ncbi:Mps2p SKDI_07G1820 [Saccharomyces kudriavzevii IFO 1802]|uniref:Uncharacterized protein n=2 Tax=Saccharomyces kudriavzevii (strain ATCC MYA-4449 / AS 2.2408 / CBS 8840 / NBRC 1802 / NCYC 2889) TaxID=226230 RepID=A0AA35JJD8_SACK1|nr:uncharacterized protein SKDI_07G1820 [Saccharomyces kudriavzevii IFO 1802]EJT43127.1 MPS2-like protein [Saccharomyces kudriavzevii IFO 1802]CAI4061800.1 hypothetical protein SKDI_07G1820 [Saccharomyces kudriavzevii IFO 1802]
MSLNNDGYDAIFEYAWGQIDKPISGDFVYGKDLPKLIGIIEDIFREAQKDGSYDLRLPLFPEINKELFRTFSNTKTFFKIHKEDFDDIFFNLVNTSLKEVLEKAFNGLNSIPGNFMASLNLNLLSKSSNENKDSNIQEPEALTPQEKLIDSPISLLNKYNTGNTLKVQVEELQKELNMKQSLLLENERQAKELRKRLETYQQKYASIQQQFNDLQKNMQAEGNRNISETTNSDPPLVARIDQEAILEEFKKRLQRQTDTISSLKDQIRRERGLNYNDNKAAPLGRKYSTFEDGSSLKNFGDMFPSYLWVKAILKAILCFVLITGILSYAAKYLYVPDTPSQNSRLQLSWWESSGIISKIVWFFQDQTDLETEYSSNVKIDDAYSKVFGI